MEKRNIKKRAVLVGCNYPKTQFKLHGCLNDVVAMRDVLVKRFGFDPSRIEVLVDAPGPSVMPTGANIKDALNKMVKQAYAGDILFFYFSGHGTAFPSLQPGQPFMQDEAIVPCDLNLITDVDLRQLIRKLPKDSSFTILSDSCHSGGLIDKDKEQIGPSTVKGLQPSVSCSGKTIPIKSIHECLQSVSNIVLGTADVIHTTSDVASGIISGNIGSLFYGIFGNDASLKFRPQCERDLFMKSMTEDEGILLSGCQSNETSLTGREITGGKMHGAFTYAVLHILNQNPNALSNRQIVMEARKFLKENGFQQHPCLYCSDQNADAPFLGNP